VASLRDSWTTRLPFAPAVAKHLTVGNPVDPQQVYTLPDPEFRSHIKST
jgi:hypothetical protein